MKKKKPPLAVQFKFDDGNVETLSLLDVEKARLREMAGLLNSALPDLQETGELRLAELAGRLAAERNTAVRSKVGSERGATKARANGEKRAKTVKDALARNIDPPASDRHVRRILNRKT